MLILKRDCSKALIIILVLISMNIMMPKAVKAATITPHEPIDLGFAGSVTTGGGSNYGGGGSFDAETASGTPISIANKFTQTGTCAIDIKTNTIDLTNAEAVTGTYLANITGNSGCDSASGSHTLTAVDATSGKIIKTWNATIPISSTPSGFELNDVPREWELPEGVSDVSNVYFRLQISGTITAGKILYRSNGSEYAATAWLIYTGSKIHVEVPQTPYFSGFPGDGNLP